ncbi:MAG: nitrite/sulfite reductase, partial [Pseudomonadota bacterium]
DNKYKARIKILVTETGADEFTRLVEAEFAAQREAEKIELPRAEIERIHAYFTPPALPDKPATSDAFERAKAADPAFKLWADANLHAHKVAGYTSVTVSHKPVGGIAGDATDAQMDAVADLAEQYGQGDIRVSHAQNLVLPHVALDDAYEVYQRLDSAGLTAPNEGLISDMIVCPGLDYCNLANARSIPISQDIAKAFSSYEDQADIGKLHINISGCINACGHHHVGHIGILGVDKKGEEFYQITFGGRADEKAAIGDIAGPGLRAEEVPPALKRVVERYRSLRSDKSEPFIDVFERVGMEPFKEALYAAD